MEGLFSRSQNVAGFSKNDHLAVGVLLGLCSFCSRFINALALLQMVSDGFLFCAVLSGFHIKLRIPSYNKLWHFPSFPRLGATLWTVAYQALPSMGFFRQEYWRGLPFPAPGDRPNPGIEPGFSALCWHPDTGLSSLQNYEK